MSTATAVPMKQICLRVPTDLPDQVRLYLPPGQSFSEITRQLLLEWLAQQQAT